MPWGRNPKDDEERRREDQEKRDRDDRQRRDDFVRQQRNEQLQREQELKDTFPNKDVPDVVPNQPGYKNEHLDAWRDAREEGEN